MTAIYKIRGTIYHDNIDEIRQTFYYLFGIVNVVKKVRVFGEELTYCNEKFDFHGDFQYEKSTESNLFYIDFSCFNDLKMVKNLIEKMQTLFIENMWRYDLEYVKEDENGKLLSNEVEFCNPDYNSL